MADDKKLDYGKIGLKAGLEIHQQLDTGKLFCKCPGHLRKDEPDFIFRRKLHAVAGETGEIDEAVKHEAIIDREFIYQGYKDNVCLIDMDEEPPKMINENALKEVLKICLLMNCEIYSNSMIMRKTVIDGSNTSGFQRTVLIGHDGWIDTSFGKVGIESVCLEEDSARVIEKDEKKAIYRLDRLGIPLVEIATKPELDTPEKIKECALKIGEILRACNVRRGIGTIRQDLNVSIKGHDRVEIKGFQDPKIMIETVNNEIKRQQEEVKKGKKTGEVRNALVNAESEFLRPMPGKARMYPETDLPLLKIGRKNLDDLSSNLPKLKNELRQELKKKGLGDEMIHLVLDENYDDFESLIHVYAEDVNLVGKMITLWRFDIARKYDKGDDEIKIILNLEILKDILKLLGDGKISKNDVKEVMQKIVEGEDLEKAIKFERVSNKEMEEAIRNMIIDKPGLRPNAYMGLAMKEFKGKIDAKKAMEIINQILEGGK